MEVLVVFWLSSEEIGTAIWVQTLPRLFVFPIALMPLEKVWIQLFSF